MRVAVALLYVLSAVTLAGTLAPEPARASPLVTVGCVTGSAKFSSTGTEQCYTVPAGVGEVDVVAVGGQGGTGVGGGVGGMGAKVSAVMPVTPGESLFVEVAGSSAGISGGYNGGGEGGNDVEGEGGGGGGASDVRTCSTTASSCPGGLSSLESRLLVAAGGGGGGAGTRCETPGGAGGAAGSPGAGSSPSGGGGGGAGTETEGGEGGEAENSIGTGGEGTLGSGGAGQAGGHCAGGGGGGGLYGGGGGGNAGGAVAGGGGGGGGSSFVGPLLQNGSITTSATPTPSVTVTPLATPAAVAQANPAELAFAPQQQGTVSVPQLVTISDRGQGPLLVGGVSFAGADPGDFELSSWTCGLPLAMSETCQIGVGFAPHGLGARSATLILSSNSSEPVSVGLSGTGEGLPGGAAGPSGATGPAGPAGPTGPRGRPGTVELVTCLTVTTRAPKKRPPFVHRRVCTGSPARASFKLQGSGVAARVAVRRGHTVYATGTGIVDPNGTDRLVLSARRALTPGSYTLQLRRRLGGRWVTERQQISLP